MDRAHPTIRAPSSRLYEEAKNLFFIPYFWYNYIRIEWLRQDIVLKVGELSAINPQVLLQSRGKNIIWVTRSSENEMMLNIDIPDIEGNPLLQMTDNEWEFFGELTDLECPPGGRSISIESKPFKLNLIFSEADTTDLQEAIEMAQTYNFDLNIKFPALLVHFKGEMFLPSFLRITDDEIQYNNSVFKISGPMFNAIPFSLN